MTVYTQLYWQSVTIFRTVIRVAEKTVELGFVSNFLVLTLYHQRFHALTASNFTTGLQIKWLLVLEIVGMLANGAFEQRGGLPDKFHVLN